MLAIRLQRVGKKHDPSFRVVLIDSRRAAKSGSVLEVLGSYKAGVKGATQFKAERIKELITKGAQVSDTVNNLLLKSKIITGVKRDVLHHTRIKAKLAKNAPKVEETKKEEVKVAPILPEAETKEQNRFRSEDRELSIKSEESSISQPNQNDLGEIGKTPVAETVA